MKTLSDAEAANVMIAKAEKVASASPYTGDWLRDLRRPRSRDELMSHITRCKGIIAEGNDEVLNMLGLSRHGLTWYFETVIEMPRGQAEIFADATINVFNNMPKPRATPRYQA